MRKRDSTDSGAKMDTTLWMVTFGDLLMLLLTFFVLLLSMSSMDMKSLKEMFSIFGGAIGPLELSDKDRVTPRAIVHKGAGGQMELSDLDMIRAVKNHYRQIMAKRKDIFSSNPDILEDIPPLEGDSDQDEMMDGLKEIVGVSEDERGIIITLQEMVLFDSGKADIKPNIFPLLDSISEILEPIPNDILIMGHTDNLPMKSNRYRSNWELSLYRALNVHNYFIERKGLSPKRFAVGGYGDLRPRFPNKTREDRQKNRRVEIIIKNN
jgi:chemotaxis protein MotB